MDARFGPSAATLASIHSPARLALRTAAPLRRTLALVCALYASGALAAASDTADPGRFKVAAALSESAVSGDGRAIAVHRQLARQRGPAAGVPVHDQHALAFAVGGGYRGAGGLVRLRRLELQQRRRWRGHLQ